MKALWAFALAACWTGGPPAPVAQPAPRSHVRAVTAPRQLSGEESVKQLQDDLRQRGTSLLPQLVDGGVAVLDLDSGTVSTVCDAAAANAAQGWGQLLGVVQAPVFCQFVPDQGARCMLLGTGQLLVLDFDRTGDWRLIGVIVGVPGPNLGRAHMAYQAQLKAISCP